MKLGFLSAISRLAHERHPEDQLSDVFCACLNTSPNLRELFLHELFRLHRLGKTIKPTPSSWDCRTQISERGVSGKNLYDLVLVPESRSIKTDGFVIESKVSARLFKKQLIRYKESGVEHLTVITDRYPDTTIAWLKENGIEALRWSDIHRLIAQNKPRSQTDRFVFKEFSKYLEDRKMAYHDLKHKDFDEIGNILRHVATKEEKASDVVNGIGFGSAQSLLDALEDVARKTREEYFQKDARIKTWGPGYRADFDLNKEGRVHSLGFAIKKLNHEPRFFVEFRFPNIQSKKPYLEISFFDVKKQEYYKGKQNRYFISRLFSKRNSTGWADSVMDFIRSANPGKIRFYRSKK